MRLIDADVSIDRIVQIRPTNPKQSDYSHGIDVGLAMAMVAIKEQPTIEERKTGKWEMTLVKDLIGFNTVCFRCSECNCIEYSTPPFCRMCGAKMEEGEE